MFRSEGLGNHVLVTGAAPTVTETHVLTEEVIHADILELLHGSAAQERRSSEDGDAVLRQPIAFFAPRPRHRASPCHRLWRFFLWPEVRQYMSSSPGSKGPG